MMKNIKLADERIRRSRNDDGAERLFLRQTHQEFAAALNADVDNTTSEHDKGNSRNPVQSRSYLAKPSPTWDLHCRNLLKNLDGPPVAPVVVDNVLPFLTRLMEGTGPAMYSTSCVYDEKLYYGGALVSSTRRQLLPGHCFELTNGPYVQALFCNILTTGKCTGGAHHQSDKILVHFFQNASHGSHLHPELPVPWLRRKIHDGLCIIKVNDIYRRVLIVPLFKGTGGVHEDVCHCEEYTDEFLVDTAVHPLYSGPSDRKIYMTCPGLCGHKFRMPDSLTEELTCPSPNCLLKTMWI